MSVRFGSIILTFGLVYGAAAEACPPHLRELKTKHLSGKTLCQLHDQYADLRQRLEGKGFTPASRVGNLMAPRFINLPDWLAKRDRSQTRAWTAYEPAPVTWASWERSARVVDESARANLSAAFIAPITQDWLTRVTSAAGASAPAGQLRTGREFGLAITRATALTAPQIRGLRSLAFRSLINPENNLVNFLPTICLEDQTAEFQRAYSFSYGARPLFQISDWQPVATEAYFLAADGTPKQCGFIIYALPNELSVQMELWLAYVNQAIDALNRADGNADPILIASRAQRWFIAIHPYLSGNGRISRFVMDYIFESLGLPAPIVADMNDDMYTTELEWSDRVGDGLKRALRAGESCVARPSIAGCKVIKSSAPLKTAAANPEVGEQ